MNKEVFSFIAQIMRSREPVKTAAAMVLVDGKTGIEAATTTGVSPNSVSNTVVRFRNLDAEIRRVYKVKE